MKRLDQGLLIVQHRRHPAHHLLTGLAWRHETQDIPVGQHLFQGLQAAAALQTGAVQKDYRGCLVCQTAGTEVGEVSQVP